jgi:hypothetical protein
MLEGVLSLLMQAEIQKAQLEIQQKADSYYVANPPQQTYKYNITYDISSRGTIKGDLDEFARVVEATFNDSRGWIRAGVKFTRVQSGGRLHMILAEGESVRAAAPGGCSAELSCTVFPLVLINDDRWMGGSNSYNELGVSIADYRTLVINHEVGHFLGHNHIAQCETSTGIAPIMLQQSTGLRGCKPNSWPLPSELWVTRH